RLFFLDLGSVTSSTKGAEETTGQTAKAVAIPQRTRNTTIEIQAACHGESCSCVPALLPTRRDECHRRRPANFISFVEPPSMSRLLRLQGREFRRTSLD